MSSYRVKDWAVTIAKQGSKHFTKASYPIRFGTYSEIRTPRHEILFNLRGQIRFIRGLDPGWRHPGEVLKRTEGNDWVYYSLGSVGAHIVNWLGEYYLPCPTYATNAVYEFQPFNEPEIMGALGAWSQLYGDIYQLDRTGLPPEVVDFFDLVRANDDTTVFRQAQKLQAIIGQRPSVLPPDTRHVDYEVIPLTVADGCRYHCGFCCVKSPMALRSRSLENVRQQIADLAALYGPDLRNYKALFLGNHDALGAEPDILLAAAGEAIKAFGLAEPELYMFASVDSLLAAGYPLLAGLSKTGHYTYINMGLESAHTPTLKAIKKPLDADRVKEAFQRMLAINSEYSNIEVTANFLLGEDLPPEHLQSIMELLAGAPNHGKGAVYLSPLLASQKRSELLKDFFALKEQSNLPAYVYLIQRL
jgi:radical SAM superfamily enzyme